MTEGDETAPTGLHDPGRLLALTDGIFAISMTLLALDVRFPESVADTAAAYDKAAENGFYGRFVVFFVAFLITSRFWLVSHNQLNRLRHVDHGVLERSILFLFGICAIPVATSVLFRFGDLPEAVTLAALVLAGTGLLSARLWWYLSSPAHDLAAVPPDEREETMLRMVLVVAAYLLAIPVAYALVPVDKVGYSPLVWFLFIVIDRLAARLHRWLVRLRERRAGRAQRA